MDTLKVKQPREIMPVTIYEKDVEEVLEELNLNNDSLDRPDFDVIAYINEVCILVYFLNCNPLLDVSNGAVADQY